MCEVKIKRQHGRVEIRVVINKEELFSDELMNQIDQQREFEEKNQVESTLKKLQNSIVKLKKKKTLRLFGGGEERESREHKKKKKSSFKKKKHHRKRSEDSDAEEGNEQQGRFFCDVCNSGYAFPTKLALKKHVKLHEKGKNFRCSYPGCNGIF